MYKKSRRKKKNKVFVCKSKKKLGLSLEEFVEIQNLIRIKTEKILVLNTSFKKY